MSTPGETIVDTGAGAVRGRSVEHGVTAFLGIPYAAPPVGALRFEPPATHEPWTDVRDAREHGATAPQSEGVGPVAELLPNRLAPGDDYLVVNVWTPDVSARLPVMVFIHGGSFVSGSGSVPIYDGTAFARDGVVLVTINYRLGADGFLWTGEGTPNLGLLDQVAALEWVRDEIGSFGGDPTRVTVFGESAGAMSVVALMAMPRAAALFSRAIAQSGAGVSAIAPASAVKVAARVAEILGVAATREAIASVPVERLVAASSQVAAEVAKKPTRRFGRDIGRNLMIFEPVIDGVILPGLPEDLIARAASRDVELLIGTNADEARLFFVPTGADQTMSPLAAQLFAWTFGARRPGTVARYRRNRPGASAGEVSAAILTDGYYRAPALRLALAHGRAHVYEFAWRAPLFDGRLGACHAMELPFVFDTLDQPGAAALTGEGAPREVARRMHGAWVAFATTGDPGWPRYSADTRVALRFDVETGVTADDRAGERALWRRPPRLGAGAGAGTDAGAGTGVGAGTGAGAGPGAGGGVQRMRFEFSGELYRWSARKELWTFVALPDEASDEILALVDDMTNGWGSVRVDASVGGTRFRTSIFPDREKGAFVLPVKKSVRDAEHLTLGDTVRASVTLVDF